MKIWAKVVNGEVVETAETMSQLAAKLGVSLSSINRAVYEVRSGKRKTSCYKEIDAEEIRPEARGYCDRCSGAIPYGATAHVTISYDRANPITYRLCRSCAVQAKLFLEGDI